MPLEPAPSHTGTYQGRMLVRPDEEVVDQGLGFDLDTLLDRRQMLRALGFGAAALGLAACGSGSETSSSSSIASTSASGSTSTAASSAPDSGEIPDETAGPYPGDGSNGPDVLAESGIIRNDIRSSFGSASATAAGVPMTLELSIKDLANGGAPFAGVAVYVWHCDQSGSYSMYSSGIENENYLRGVQIAGADGTASYISIFPACYSGRWPHIHFEVYSDAAGITDVSKVIATSQVALPKDACDVVYAESGYSASAHNLAQVSLATDNVFGDDSAAHQLATVTGDVTSGYKVALTVNVDTTTTPTGGQLSGDGAPSGGPGGGPPSGGPGGGQAPSGGPGGPGDAPTAATR